LGVIRPAPSNDNGGSDIVAVCPETGSGAKLDRVERKRVMAPAQAREIDVGLVTEL
jgi:putative DNA-invertase from lambdoid prophage Rac